MADNPFTATLGRPLILVAIVAGLIAIVMWQFADTTVTQKNEFADDVMQNPTGAGSNPDGVAAESLDGVTLTRDPAAIIEGSSDAADQTAIEGPAGASATVPDPGGRTLSADEVIDPERGQVNPETGLVRTNEDAGIDAEGADLGGDPTATQGDAAADAGTQQQTQSN